MPSVNVEKRKSQGSQTLCPPRPIQRSGKRLSSHAKAVNAKCDSAPSCTKCSSALSVTLIDNGKLETVQHIKAPPLTAHCVSICFTATVQTCIWKITVSSASSFTGYSHIRIFVLSVFPGKIPRFNQANKICSKHSLSHSST